MPFIFHPTTFERLGSWGARIQMLTDLNSNRSCLLVMWFRTPGAGHDHDRQLLWGNDMCLVAGWLSCVCVIVSVMCGTNRLYG